MSVYCTTSDLPVLRKQNNAAKHNHAEPGIIIYLMFGCPPVACRRERLLSVKSCAQIVFAVIPGAL